MNAIAVLATQKVDGKQQKEEAEKTLATAAVGRMLKALVQGGRYEKAAKRINLVDTPLKFDELLYSKIKETRTRKGW